MRLRREAIRPGTACPRHALRRSGRTALFVLAALLAAGCATRAPEVPRTGDAGPAAGGLELPAPGVAAFEQRQLERAATLEQRDQLAEALVAWEILALLRPDVGKYRDEAAALRARIASQVGQRNAAAARAQAANDLDGAQRLYLQSLALDPSDAQAADGLRAIERERNRRSYLRKVMPPLPSKESAQNAGAAAGNAAQGGGAGSIPPAAPATPAGAARRPRDGD